MAKIKIRNVKLSKKQTKAVSEVKVGAKRQAARQASRTANRKALRQKKRSSAK